MDDKNAERKIIFQKVAFARLNLAEEIKRGVITEEDIIGLMSQDCSFGLEKQLKFKKKLLGEIFNSPFLLCDQPYLSEKIKKLLPTILRTRYEFEIEELYYLEGAGYISTDELIDKKAMLKFCYYETSIEASEIFHSGYVKKRKQIKK